MKKDWKRNWNNVSLVSKHWNSIAWISFQRTVPKSEKEIIFLQACKKGGFPFINKFLTQDTIFDPSFQNNTAIQWASSSSFVDIVKLLLQNKRVDPSANANFVIRCANKTNQNEIIELLSKDKKVDPSTQNNYAIKMTCKNILVVADCS